MSEVYPAMISQALALLHDPEEAQDVVQDVAARLWHAPRSLERADNRRAYCIMAVRNAAVSVLRSARHFENLDHAVEIVDKTTEHDEAEFVEHIIDSLPPAQKLVVRLRIMEGLEYDRIAAITGFTEVNVRKLLSRARKDMRKRYGQYN